LASQRSQGDKKVRESQAPKSDEGGKTFTAFSIGRMGYELEKKAALRLVAMRKKSQRKKGKTNFGDDFCIEVFSV
jgi:hypothetical protein